MQTEMIVQTSTWRKIQYVESIGDKSAHLTPIKGKAYVFHSLIKAKAARDLALGENTKATILRYT